MQTAHDAEFRAALFDGRWRRWRREFMREAVSAKLAGDGAAAPEAKEAAIYRAHVPALIPMPLFLSFSKSETQRGVNMHLPRERSQKNIACCGSSNSQRMLWE